MKTGTGIQLQGLLLSALATVALCSAAASAEERPHRFGVGIQVSYGLTSNATLAGLEAEFQAAAVVGGTISYSPRDWFALELGVEYSEVDFDLGIENRTDSFGTLRQTPFHLTAKFRTETHTPGLTLYAGGGASYFLNDIDENSGNDGTEDFFALNRTITTVGDDFGFHGCIGFEYALREHIAVTLDIRAVFTEVDTTVLFPDGSSQDSSLSFNSLRIGVGATYYF